jgi:hypothetical protein
MLSGLGAIGAADGEPPWNLALRCQSDKIYAGDLGKLAKDPKPYPIPLEVPGTVPTSDEVLDIHWNDRTYAYLRYDSTGDGQWHFFVWGHLGKLCDTIQDIIDEVTDKLPPA